MSTRHVCKCAQVCGLADANDARAQLRLTLFKLITYDLKLWATMADVGFGVYVNGHTNYSMEWSSVLFEYSYINT